MKKKLIFIFIILAIIGTAIGVTAYINSKTNNKGPVEALGYVTTTKDLPTDGSTINDYDSYDNLAIIAGLMENVDFHGETNGQVKAKVAFINYTQDVYNLRTIIGDEGFQQAVSTSSLKSVAIQKHFDFKNQIVLTRNPDKIDGKNTTWLNDVPQVYSNKQYLSIYGWIPNQISAYVLCKESILEISDLIDLGEGQYEIDLSLNPNIAPVNYQYEVKTYGGSSDFPSFSSIKLKVIFDANWQLKEIQSEEVYDITMPVIGSITCTGNLTETFTYDNLSIQDKDYFDKYADLKPSDDNIYTPTELKPLDYFMYAFGPYLNGDILAANVELNINDNLINGTLYVDLKNNKYGFKSNSLNLLVEDNLIYLEFNKIKVKTDINNLTDLFGSSEINLDTNDLMNQLNNGVITKDGNNTNLFVKLNLLGLELPINFNFNEEGENISLIDVSTNLTISDINIGLKANIIKDSFNLNINKDEFKDLKNIDFIINNIKDIITNKNVIIDLEFIQNNINVNGQIKALFKDNLALSGNLNLNIDDKQINILLNYQNDTLYLDVLNLKLSITKDKLLSLLPETDTNIDLNTILNYIFNIDYNKLINNFDLKENELNLGLDLTDFNLSNYNISLINDNGIKLNISELSLTLKLSSDPNLVIEQVTGNYYDISYLFDHLENIISVLNNPYLNLNVTTELTYGVLAIPVNLDVLIDVNNFSIYLKGSINLFGTNLLIEGTFKDNIINLKIGNDLTLSLTIEELLSYFTGNNIEFDLNNILNNLSITSSKEELNLGLSELSFSDIKLSNTNTKVTKGEEFSLPSYEIDLTKSDIDNLILVINNLIKIINNGNLEINLNYNDIKASLIVNKDFNISGQISLGNINLNLAYMNGLVYLSYDKVGITGSLVDILNLVGEFVEIPEISLDLNCLITDISTDINVVNLALLGLNLNIMITDSITIKELNNNIDINITNIQEDVNLINLDYINISDLSIFIPKIKELINNETINLNLNTNISYKDLVLNIKGLVNVNKAGMIYGDININDKLNLSLAYNDTLKIKFNSNVIEMPLNEAVNISDLSLIINSISLSDNKLNIFLSLNEISLNIIIDKDFNISLSDININDLIISNTNLSITSNNEEIKTITEETTLNINDLMKEVNPLIEVISNGLIELSLNTTLVADTTSFNVEANINIDINNLSISGEIKFITSKGVNHIVYLDYSNNNLSLSYGNIGVYLSINELDTLINKVFGNSISLDIDLYEIINSLVINYNNGLNINLDLAGLGNISLNLNNNVIKLSNLNISDISLVNTSLSINKLDNYVSYKQDIDYLNYNDLNNVLEIINQILDLTKEEGLSFNISGNISLNNQVYSIDGYINLLFRNGLELEAEVTILDEHYVKLYRKIEGGKAIYYLVYDNLVLNHSEEDTTLNFKANEEDLNGFLDTLSNFFNFDFSEISNDISNLKGFNIIDLIDSVDFSQLIKEINVLEDTNKVLNLIINKDFLGQNNDIIISLIAGETLSLELTNLGISGINVDKLALALTGTYNSDIQVPDLKYYDLSMLNPLLNTIFNTALLTDFNIQGKIKVEAKIIGIPIDMDVPVEARIKRVEGSTKPEIYAKINVPVIIGVNPVPYKGGDVGPGKDRVFEIYYKDGYVYLYRTEKVSRFLAKDRTYTKGIMISEETFMNNIMYYLLEWGFGFSSDIMNAINKGLNIEHSIDFTNVITDLSKTDKSYNVGINLAELTGNNQLGTANINIIESLINDVSYLTGLNFNINMPIASGVDINISTSNLALINIGEVVDLSNLYDYINNYSHALDEDWEIE